MLESRSKLIFPTAVEDYFEAINRRDFQRAADLFLETGALVAPLGNRVRGRAPIARYLSEQCDEMRLCPEIIQSSRQEFVVVEGWAECLAFKVKVQWSFYLCNNALAVVKVQLITRLAELSHLQNSKYAQI